MKQTKTPKILKHKAPAVPNLIVNDMRIISVDRTTKDIQTWRNALINAESIYYPNRTRLYDLYMDVLTDAFITGIINKRIDTVLNKKIAFIANDNEVEQLEPLIKSKVFRDIKKQFLLTQFWGITGLEFIPGTDVAFEPIPRKHIKPEIGVIVMEQSVYEGLDYNKLPLVFVCGDKRDYGLLLQASPSYLYKKGNFADWANFVEIFGQPIRVAKYDANDLKTKQELSKAITDAGNSLALMIPKQAEFELIEAKSHNATGDLQKSFKDSLNDELAILILGNTETTGNSNGGSNAKAQEQGKQQAEIVKSDMDYLLSQLNSPKFIAILKSYGLPIDGGAFKFESEIDLTELSQKIIIDQIVSTKEPIGADYWYDTYAIPKPDNYDQLKKKMEDDKVAQQNAKLGFGGNNQRPINNQSKDKSKDKNKDKKLSSFDKWRMKVADFFAQAHKD